MTDIEQKALALLKECVGNAVWKHPITQINREANLTHEALCRAIEQHEAFRQEVSDAVEELKDWPTPIDLRRFIIAKPDPLVEAMIECGFGDSSNAADDIRAALAKRGLEIREKSK